MSILACADGYYGKKCKNECSENCDVPKQCDKVTGRCQNGCKPGWTTTTCKQSMYFDTTKASIWLLKQQQLNMLSIIICLRK